MFIQSSQSLAVTLALLMIPKLSFTFEVSVTNIAVKRSSDILITLLMLTNS